MQVVNFSETRANLKGVMDQVVADKAPVVVHRRSAEPVVMVALSEWRSMEETLHLLSSPPNAARLREAVGELDAGGGVERPLSEA